MSHIPPIVNILRQIVDFFFSRACNLLMKFQNYTLIKKQ